MTTTNDKMRARVIALMERARGTSNEHEATACREKAEQLVTKYALPASLLTEKFAPQPSAARVQSTQPERRYPCRFGCGVFVQHTADEMSACAERKRNETGRDSAYDVPPRTTRPRAGAFNFSDFNDFFRAAGADPRTSYTHPGAEKGRTYTNTPPRARATGSHANCDHPATKSARAHCRKMRSMGL